MKRSPLAPLEQAPVNAVSGVTLNTASTGMKYKNRDDLMLMCFDQPVTVAAVFTRSLTASAPVDWCRRVLSSGCTQAILSCW